jgi:prephenate dehydrogenase
MPVDTSIAMLEQSPAGQAALTTVCSVMAPFHDIAVRRQIPLVAGHPLAGSEKRGLAAADPDLFRGKRWFVDGTVEHAAVDEMVAVTGAETVWVDCEEHDRALAYTSHLPQLLATALASTIRESGVRFDLFAGSGLRTTLRLAGSDRTVWHSIFESNAPHIDVAVDRLAENVRLLLGGDDEEVFERAQDLYALLKREENSD